MSAPNSKPNSLSDDYVNETPAQRLERAEKTVGGFNDELSRLDKQNAELRDDLADITAVLLETFNIITKNSASDRATRVKALIPKVQEIRSRLT